MGGNLDWVRIWSSYELGLLDVLYNHIMILATISNQFEERITLGRNATHPTFFSQWKFIASSQWPMNKNVKLPEIKLRWFD